MAHNNRKKLHAVTSDDPPAINTSLRPTTQDIARGARIGFFFAIGFSVIALLIFAVEGPRPFQRNDTPLGLVISLYLIGFTVAGLIAGTFHRLAGRYPWIAYLVGITAATPMTFATTAAVTHNALLWQTGDWVPASILSIVYGILGVRMFRKDPIKWD